MSAYSVDLYEAGKGGQRFSADMFLQDSMVKTKKMTRETIKKIIERSYVYIILRHEWETVFPMPL